MIEEKSVLSATLEKLNLDLFLNPVFQNYYLKLFYDVDFSDGMRGFHTENSHTFCGNQKQAKIVYQSDETFMMRYIDYAKKMSRSLEIAKGEHESVLFTTRYVYLVDGVFYHMTERQVLKDNQVYPIQYQYVGFDEKAIDEKEYHQDWVYQADFVDKMKQNGIAPIDEHRKDENRQKNK